MAIPGVLDRYRVARLLAQGQLLQLNVAGRWLTVNLGDHVLGAQPGRGSGPTGDHRLDEEPFGEPCLFGGCGRYRYRLQPEEGVGHPAGGDDLVRDALGQIDRYGKTKPDAAASRVRYRRTSRRHPHQLALAVDQSTAADRGHGDDVIVCQNVPTRPDDLA